MVSPPPFKRRRIVQEKPVTSPPLRRKQSTCQASSDRPTINTLGTFPDQQDQHEPLDNRKSQLEIISWNVNGISHLLPSTTQKITRFFSKKSRGASDTDDEDTDGKLSEKAKSPLREFLRRHGFPQMLCLQEVKIPRNDERLKKAVRWAANFGEEHNGRNADFVRYEVYFSLPRDKFNAIGWGGKVYGVCTLIRTDIFTLFGIPNAIPKDEATTKPALWDTEGRVLITELLSRKLVVINGYWVNGTSNTWRDSITGAVKGNRHDAKLHFHTHMLTEVKEYEARGWNVVLVGDMNVARTAIDGFPGIRTSPDHVANRKDFNNKFFENEDGMEGVDTWRHVHGDKRGYSYHGEKAEEWGRSCDRVDLGIVSRELVHMGALIGADIWESVKERGRSDHVPIGVVLDVGNLARGDEDTQTGCSRSTVET